MNVLIIASPVQAIGLGNAGGVDITLENIANVLLIQNHNVTLVAPEGSTLNNDNIELVLFAGSLQASVQTYSADTPIFFLSDSVLVKMCEYALTQNQNFDLILNMAYDWLPMWLTQFSNTPIYHLVSMSNENENIASILRFIDKHFPGRIALHSATSASTYQFENPVFLLPNAFNSDRFPFSPSPKKQLAWVGRISPEKGLENAIEVATKLNIPLHVWGKVQTEQYKQDLLTQFPNANIIWRGFVSHKQLLKEMSESSVMLMTPNWIEAFGNNVVEAISCGVPVVTYNRGGPAEIVDNGITGFTVEVGDHQLFADKVIQAMKLSREKCRSHALQKFDFEQYGQKLSTWLNLT